MLSGWRTYICSAIVFLASIAFVMGWITRDQFEAIAGIFMSTGLAALRVGVKNDCLIKGE